MFRILSHKKTQYINVLIFASDKVAEMRLLENVYSNICKPI